MELGVGLSFPDWRSNLSNQPFDRRMFIRFSSATLGTCACGTVLGCAKANTTAKPVTGKRDDRGRVPLGPASDLAVGQELKVSVPGIDDPVLVARVSETEVRAVSIGCTHFGSEVVLMLDQKGFSCPSHGSLFAYDGAVIEGPASDPLRSYEVVEQDGQLMLLAAAGK